MRSEIAQQESTLMMSGSHRIRQRWRAFVGVGTASMGITGLVLLLQDHWQPNGKANSVPNISAISDITASVYNQPWLIQDVGPFRVPPKYYEIILRLFRPSDQYRGSVSGREVGCLDIRSKDGHQTHVTLRWVGTVPLRYEIAGKEYERGGIYRAIDGKDKFLDESAAFTKLLAAISVEASTGKQDPQFEHYLHMLERSSGLRTRKGNSVK